MRMAETAAATKLPVASFDRDLDKFPDMQRFEPEAGENAKHARSALDHAVLAKLLPAQESCH